MLHMDRKLKAAITQKAGGRRVFNRHDAIPYALLGRTGTFGNYMAPCISFYNNHAGQYNDIAGCLKALLAKEITTPDAIVMTPIYDPAPLKTVLQHGLEGEKEADKASHDAMTAPHLLPGQAKKNWLLQQGWRGRSFVTPERLKSFQQSGDPSHLYPSWRATSENRNSR
jgi:hypothetical protein